MENIIIKLKFNTTITRIAGNDYGKEIYNTQVKDLLKKPIKNGTYTIVFPSNIVAVASSFIQGFIYEISKEIIPELFYKYFTIEGTDQLKEDFKEGVYY